VVPPPIVLIALSLVFNVPFPTPEFAPNLFSKLLAWPAFAFTFFAAADSKLALATAFSDAANSRFFLISSSFTLLKIFD
jgi:hypothetical protein